MMPGWRTTAMASASVHALGRERAAQVETLLHAEPEVVRDLLQRWRADPSVVAPLRRVWQDESGPRRLRMRAGLALRALEPAQESADLRDELAAWMLETDNPEELLLVRAAL